MRYLKNFVKVAISVGLLGYLVHISDPDKILDVLSNINRASGVYFLLGAILAGGFSIFLMALRWKVLLKQYSINVPVMRLFGFYLVGLFFNNFLPTSIGGDIVRIYRLINDTSDRSTAFASVVVERLFGITATLFMAITSLYYVSQYFQDDRVLYVSIILLFFIIGFFILITRKRPFEFLLRIFDQLTILRIGERINKLMEAIHALREKRRAFVWIFLLSLISQTCIVIMNFALVKALDIEVDLIYLFLVVPVTFILTLLPSINGIGIRDGGFVFLFDKIGLPAAAGLSLSLMNVVIPMLISVCGAVLFISQRKKMKIDEVEAIEKSL